MRIDEHCHGQSHPSLSPRISHPGESKMCNRLLQWECKAGLGFPRLGPAKQHCPPPARNLLRPTHDAVTHRLGSKTWNLYEPLLQMQTGTSPCEDVFNLYYILNYLSYLFIVLLMTTITQPHAEQVTASTIPVTVTPPVQCAQVVRIYRVIDTNVPQLYV